MLQFPPLVLKEISNTPTDEVSSTKPRQQSMQRYLVDLAASLTGSDAERSRSRLLRTTYNLLKQSSGTATGQSARMLAEQIEQKSWSRLQPWIRKCLLALESKGLAYRTYDEHHFSVTNSELELDDPSVTSLVEEVFSSMQADAEDTEMLDDDSLPHASRTKSTRSMRRAAIVGGRWRKGACNGLDGFRSLECTGSHNAAVARLLWSRAMKASKKARLFDVKDSNRSTARVCSVEFSPSGEYVLSATSSGRIQVFRCSSASHSLMNSWEDAQAAPASFPIRDVPGVRSVELARWNPGNRNEVGTCSKASADIHSYDMKRCGQSSDRQKNAPTTIFSHKGGQGKGGVLDFSFVPSLNMIVAGTTGGTAMLWDSRSARAPKMSLPQRCGGLCFTQVLSGGHTLVGGTTEGTVHVWDLRAARAGMNVMSLGGRDEGAIFTAHIDSQLPVMNADGEFCDGSLVVPAESLRSYALEPSRELELAFAFGRGCVGILNLLSRKVSHVHMYSSSDDYTPPDASKRRLAWLSPSPRRSTLAHGLTDDVSLLQLTAEKRGKVWDELSQLEVSRFKVPGELCCLAAHPTDPSIALGVQSVLWSMSFGHGLDEC